jgi:hypothetical protein
MRKKTCTLATIFLLAATTFAKTNTGLPKYIEHPAPGVSFTENKGQIHDQHHKPRPDVLYGTMAGNMAVHIKNKGLSYQLYRIDKYKEVEDPKTKQKRREINQHIIYRIDLNWLNHNANFTTTEGEALPGYNNYYLGSCPNGALNVKSYKEITLKNLYKGINLHYYEKNGELKHDYVVAPHADFNQIQIQVEGADLNVNEDGSLILTTPLGKVQEGAPVVYQNGRQLKAKWRIKNNILSFDIENYNSNYELIIDPVTRIWGTYYGGQLNDYSYACTTDASGNVYMAGYTDTATGTIIATSGSHQSTFAGVNFYDGFLVKFTAAGVRLWGTYYGGTGEEYVGSCATDASGNVYLAGETGSSNVIATFGSHQSVIGVSGHDGFLVKFNANGVRLWGTYYGGTGNDFGCSCATDTGGNVYLSGTTGTYTGTAIATLGCHQPVFGGYSDAFLAKFNSSGVRQWGTYYGGQGYDYAYSCATDLSGNVYLSGETDTGAGTVIATPGSHQQLGGGNIDGFLIKFNTNGLRQWGTYYGGTGYDSGYSCATDTFGNVHLAGYTTSTVNISTVGSHQPTYAGGSWDAFLVKFDAGGVRQWGTYYGGPANDYSNSGQLCATDVVGNVYLAGTANSTGTAIATPVSHQSVGGGNYDGFLVKFNASGVRQWGTFYGGSASNDCGYSCATDVYGSVYLSGIANTTNNIATPGSHQSAWSNGFDGFLAKFDDCSAAPAQPVAIAGPTAACAGAVTSYSTPIVFGTSSYTWLAPPGWSGSSINHSISLTPGSSGVFTLIAGNGCGASPPQTLSITVNPLPTITVNNGAICSGESFTLVANGASSYTFSSGPVVSPIVSTTYSVIGTSTAGCKSSNAALSYIVVFSLPVISVNSGAICLGQSFTIVPGGASTYTFSSGPVVSPSSTSSYSVVGTSASGCVSSNTAVSTVTVSTIHPTVTVNSGTICQGNSFTLTPGGAYTYTIQGGNSIVSPASTTNYTVVGTSTAGCISSNTAISNVVVNPLPIINISTNDTTLCVGEEATLTATGAQGFTFNPGGVGASILISPTITSVYSVTGTDANGCSNTVSFTQMVDECTSIKNKEFNNADFIIFPNPTKGSVNLELGSDTEVVIINAIGQVVYTSKLKPGKHTIDLEDLAKGIYVVKTANTADSKNYKLIKE